MKRPARSDSVATGPVREIPPHLFKCDMHGATLPVEQRHPDSPDHCQACRPCWAKWLDTSDKNKNPLSH